MQEQVTRRPKLPDLAVQIHCEVEAADRDWRSALGHAIKAGELLIDAKSRCKHGQWLPWLQANGLGERTARNYMRLAANRQEPAVLEGLTIEGALKLLAAPRQDAKGNRESRERRGDPMSAGGASDVGRLGDLIVRELGLYMEVPPWGRELGPGLAVAHGLAAAGRLSAVLVPARPDTAWWWSYCRHHEVRFLRGRLRFAGTESGAPFPSAVVLFGLPACSRWWDWRSGAAPRPPATVVYWERAA